MPVPQYLPQSDSHLTQLVLRGKALDLRDVQSGSVTPPHQVRLFVKPRAQLRSVETHVTNCGR